MKPSAKFVMIAPFAGVFVLLLAGAPGVALTHRWSALRVAGLVLILVGLGLVTLARWQLGDSFSIEPRATALVTRGLYARIRNPVYVFGLAFVAGLLLYMNVPQWLPVLVPLAIMQWVRARREAKVLEARFGEEYRAYRSRTWF